MTCQKNLTHSDIPTLGIPQNMFGLWNQVKMMRETPEMALGIEFEAEGDKVFDGQAKQGLRSFGILWS